MSFLSGAGGAAGAGLAGGANGAATGLGHMIGVDPSRISELAGKIGAGMNAVASAGGADPGYQAPVQPTNYLQNLDPNMLQSILDRFRPMPLTTEQAQPMARAPGGFY